MFDRFLVEHVLTSDLALVYRPFITEILLISYKSINFFGPRCVGLFLTMGPLSSGPVQLHQLQATSSPDVACFVLNGGGNYGEGVVGHCF